MSNDPEPIELSPLDELLVEASLLVDLDAARAEAWASGLLAELPDHDDLLAGLRTADDDRALALAVALTPLLAGAQDVVDALAAAGRALPPFATTVGTAEPVGAWAITDLHGGGTSIVIEYEHRDGARHDVLIEIDDGVAVDILVSSPGVAEVALDESDRRLRVDRIATADAIARVRDAFAMTAQRPDAPVTDAFLLNQALLAARVGGDVVRPVAGGDSVGRVPRDVDPDGDAFALSTLSSALDLAVRAPSVASAAAASLRRAAHRGDPDVIALLGEASVVDSEAIDDATLLIRVAGGYVRPGPRVGLSPAAAEAIDGLEWADWLGAVLPLVRAGVGADASPEQLVRNINRCPEVTTSIPKRDAPAVASAFGCALPAWRVTSAIDEDDRLTALGAWLLPQALASAWRGDPR